LDSVVFSNLSQGAGTYFFQVFGPSNVLFAATPPLYNNPTANCGIVGCNLVPNGSFEDFTFFSAVTGNFLAWGLFNNQANCWGNPNLTGVETPDLARAMNDTAFCTVPSPIPNTPINGNRCYEWDYSTWEFGGTGLNAGGWNSAHIVIQRQPNDNRREYIQVPVGLNNPNGLYYVRFGTRCDPVGQYYNDAMGLYFSHTNGVGEVQGVQGQFTQTANGLLLDLTPTAAPVSTLNWEVRSRIFQNDGTAKDNMMVGNFFSNAATNARSQLQNTFSTLPFAWIYLDGFELYELPNGGNDLTVCAGTPFTLGQAPTCSPPGTVSTLWLGPAGFVSTTPVVSQTLNTPGTYQYTLMVTYGGEFFQDVVNVTVTPSVTGVAPVIVSDPCGATDIEIGGLNGSLVYTITSTDISFPPMVNVPAAGGQITIVNPQVNYTGTGTIQITASFPGSVCPTASFTLGVAPCCSANPGGLTLVNEPTSPLLGTSISGQVINMFGTVAVDQNTVFDNCVFFMGTDAQIVLDPGVQAEFYACQFQVCNDFMWDRLYVPKTSSLVMVDNTVSYAVRGVYLEDAIGQLANNTFEGNLTANQFVDYQANGQNVTFENNIHNLTGNTYNGIGIHPQSTLTWGGSLWNYNAFVIGTNIEQSVDLTLGSSGQSNNSYTGFPTNYDEQIGVVNYQSVSDLNGGTFTGQLLGYAGEDAVCNVGVSGNNTFNNCSSGGMRLAGCTGIIRGNQFIGSNQFLGNPTSMVILNPSASNETYVFGNNFSGGSHLWAEVMGGVPYNSTQPVRLRVNDNSFTMPNNNFPGTDAITFKGLMAEKASTRKVMAHGNTISFSFPGLWEAGIYAENCPEVLIAANDISGPSGTGGSRRLIGIHVNNSSDGDVANNFLNELHDGIRISGVQTAVNYQGTQYTCNNLSNCNIGMYFNGADIEDQGAVNYSVENQFSLNGVDLNGSVISANTDYRTLNLLLSGTVSNLSIQSALSNQNACVLPSPSRPGNQASISVLKVFPNPVRAGGLLQFSKAVTGSFYLMSLQGQVLSSGVLKEASEINLSGIPAGTYVMRVENEVFKIIVL
jgi:hypothetical protein